MYMLPIYLVWYIQIIVWKIWFSCDEKHHIVCSSLRSFYSYESSSLNRTFICICISVRKMQTKHFAIFLNQNNLVYLYMYSYNSRYGIDDNLCTIYLFTDDTTKKSKMHGVVHHGSNTCLCSYYRPFSLWAPWC